MKSFRDKMYNHEVTPPLQSWQIISSALDNGDNTSAQSKKTSSVIYVRLAAACLAFVIITVLWFVTSTNTSNKITAKQSLPLHNNSGEAKNAASGAADAAITVPGKSDEGYGADDKTGKVKNSDTPSAAKAEILPKKYITISGPEGQPVKISAKAASLIVSSDDSYPPNTVWDEKVKKWKDIMKANTLAPTTANFLDIVELTQALTIKNP